ncbi:MAG: class I SAM-dependent methyltransferase [Anaerolineae bacterium]|nr:class I SAM-dependent methyltransferase [Anaerolineae bacterium]
MARPWFDHFRFAAPFYDRLFAGGEPAVTMLDALDLPADGWLLDAGGGTGRISASLLDRVGGVVVTDASGAMLRQAREKGGLHPTLGHAEALPFPAGAFARILVVDAFHHFYRHAEAASELWRVLAPGGRLVILEPNIARWPVRLVALGEKLLLMRSRFFNAAALEALIGRQAGAQIRVDTTSAPYYIMLVASKAAQPAGCEAGRS